MKVRRVFGFSAFLLFGAVCVTVLTGCATPASREAMQPKAVTSARTHPYSVAVKTAGGSETAATGIPNVSDAEFKAAIEKAIVDSGLFGSVVDDAGSDYELTVTIAQMKKPFFGASFTVSMEAGWLLQETSDKSIVMRQAVQSSFTATMADSLIGVSRLRIAVEGAARENIAAGLKEIAALSL
jgi:hypothetical protein